MVFDYFSWARAKKNKADLEKTNPTDPVLNESDEQFLHKVTTQEDTAPPLPPTVISDDGQEKEVETEEQAKEAEAAGTLALPASPSAKEQKDPVTADDDNATPESSMEKTDGSQEPTADDGDDDTKDQSSAQPEEPIEPVAQDGDQKTTDQSPDESKEATTEQPTEKQDLKSAEVSSEAEPAAGTEKEAAGDVGDAQTDGNTSDDKPQQSKRTWASYVPSVPSVPSVSLPSWGSKGKGTSKSTTNSTSSPPEEKKVDEGISIKEGVTLEKDPKQESESDDEKEVSVLLDKLNLSSINNRVFSFSKQSQNIYEEFTVILKDMINGAPTAYDDMEKLLKNNEGHLGEMFGNMPPFVQTLVKSLPAKLGSSLGPEILAAASEKPGADMKTRMASASDASASSGEGSATNKKRKGKVPNVKSLVSEKGAVTSMLKSIVSFLKVRFPAFITGTNVIMSLAVFILLFVFWYCHKRGKETRLLKNSEVEDVSASEVSDMEDSIVLEKPEGEEESGSGDNVAEPAESPEDAEGDDDDVAEKLVQEAEESSGPSAESQATLDQPQPVSVPLPAKA